MDSDLDLSDVDGGDAPDCDAEGAFGDLETEDEAEEADESSDAEGEADAAGAFGDSESDLPPPPDAEGAEGTFSAEGTSGDRPARPGPREVPTQDVLLPFELARLEGMEAVRIERGADLVHGDTRGETRALYLALRYVGDPDPRRRSPWLLVREGPWGRDRAGTESRLALREARIAGPLEAYLPSDEE